MKILYIHQHFTTREGSSGTRSYEFSKYLVSQGHQVTIISGNNERSSIRNIDEVNTSKQLISRIDIDGIYVCVINIKDSNKLAVSSRVWNFVLFMFLACYVCLKEKNVDLVFATSTPLTTGIPGLLTKIVKGIPFVFEVRDIWPESVIQLGTLKNPFIIKLSEFLEKLFYKFSQRIVVISYIMKQRLVARSLPSSKIEVIHIGSDIDLFSSNSKDANFLSKFDLNDKFVIIFAGAHSEANALHYVVEAAKELREYSDIRFFLIGEGRQKKSLIKLAEEYSLENIIFLPPIPRVQIPGILACADLTLMILKNLQIFDTACPNKFFDYLSSGRPILVNFEGEISKMLKEFECGVYIEPDNPKDMALKILELKKNPELCKKMGINAKKLAEEYDRKKMAAKFEKLFEEVLGQ